MHKTAGFKDMTYTYIYYESTQVRVWWINWIAPILQQMLLAILIFTITTYQMDVERSAMNSGKRVQTEYSIWRLMKVQKRKGNQVELNWKGKNVKKIYHQKTQQSASKHQLL